jgi:hypothetical protein
LPRESRICLAWIASMEDKEAPGGAAMTYPPWSLVERTRTCRGARRVRGEHCRADVVHRTS